MAVLVAALAVYALGCFAASTADEAMQCCDTMPCPQHHHDDSQDCCRSMPSLHAPFLQPHTLDAASYAPMFFAMLPGPGAMQGSDSSAQILLTVNSHAPPVPPTAASKPLRI